MPAHLTSLASILTLLLLVSTSATAQPGPIHEAVDANDTVLVRKLLKKNRKLIHAVSTNDYTPLHLAVLHSFEGMVRLLLDYKPDVDAHDFVGLSPLHYASTPEIAELLIEANAIVDDKDNVEATPLHDAARKGITDVVKVLLAHGAAPNERDHAGLTPLMYAAQSVDTVIIAPMIDGGALVDLQDSYGRTALHYAVEADVPEMVTSLLHHGADRTLMDLNGLTPYDLAVEHGYGEIQSILEDDLSVSLDRPAYPNVEEEERPITPLMQALDDGEIETARSIIESGTEDLATDGPDILARAVPYRDLIDKLLDAGAPIDFPRDGMGATALHRAAALGEADLLEHLLERGATIGAHTITWDDGDTPLHLAAKNGQAETAELLLKKGADPNALSVRASVSPLHYAAENGNERVVELLIDYGANVNDTSIIGGCTPLHYAAREGHAEAARLLLEHGAWINPQDFRSQTPLHWASYGRQLDMLRLLVEWGADTAIVDWVDRTACGYAADWAEGLAFLKSLAHK